MVIITDPGQRPDIPVRPLLPDPGKIAGLYSL